MGDRVLYSILVWLKYAQDLIHEYKRYLQMQEMRGSSQEHLKCHLEFLVS